MAPMRRKRPARKAVAPSSRVHKIGSREQWESMLAKAGEGRIVVVQFYQPTVMTCLQMRPYFTKHSSSHKFRRAIFAEVDVNDHEGLARGAGVNRVPTYQCYYDGEVVDTYTGGAPDQLQQFIQRNVNEYCVGGGGPLATLAKLAAAALLVLGGALLYGRLRREGEGEEGGGGGGGGEAGGSQVLDLKKRIVAAQGKLRALEKANRGKQARAQRKLLERLQAQRRAAERGQQAARAKGDAAEAAAGGGGAARPAGGRRRGPREAAGEHDVDAVARLRRRKRLGEALYSDEEDVLVAADSVEP